VQLGKHRLLQHSPLTNGRPWLGGDQGLGGRVLVTALSAARTLAATAHQQHQHERSAERHNHGEVDDE
jgi:GTPase involved in cell partitioning and DNA repair